MRMHRTLAVLAVGVVACAMTGVAQGPEVIAIFEPRSYTAQRREFQEPYRRALAAAERVVVGGLFRPERYDETTGLDPGELAESLRGDGVAADYIPDVDQIVATVVPEARAGDVLLVMSNGSFGGIHDQLLEALRGGAEDRGFSQ